MNFRLIATEPRISVTGTVYDHTIWMGEFDGLQYDEDEAVAFAREKLGPACRIQADAFPSTLH